jgi:LmbE family N-acetylglucosaminyl deacetylase
MTSGPGERRLQYVVIPHPDDEFGAWALVAGRADSYPVFLLCAHGEATGMGDGRGYQGELGEWLPLPQPWAGPHTLTLRAQRLHSWHAFLDAMSQSGPSVAEQPSYAGVFDDGPSLFQLWVGEDSARVVFDGGDGRLTPEFVTAAIQRTRELRFTHLPVEQEDAVVGASYYNGSYDAVRYAHPDHRAIHVALWATDQGVPGPQWCRTASTDPDVAATGGRVRAMTRDTYRTAMAIDPATGQRTGLVQAAYGWLAPDDGWAQGETDATAIFSRRQSFWRRFG